MLVINYSNITDISDEDYQLLRNAVSKERRIKADRFYFIDDAKRSICAELLLQYSLFQAVGQLMELNIGYNEYGKPFINNVNSFSYNLSHSGKWVAIVYGISQVGIDIEKIQTSKMDIDNEFFTEEERQYIYTGTDNEWTKRFTQIWTLKESYVKYLGAGLSIRLNSFSVNPLDCVVTNKNGEIQKDLRLKSYLFDSEYYLSVCSVEEEVTFHEIVLEDLIGFINKVKRK